MSSITKVILIFLLFPMFFYSCKSSLKKQKENNREVQKETNQDIQDKPKISFIKSYKAFQSDTAIIYCVGLYHNDIVCLFSNSKFIVLDSIYNHNKSAERKLNKKHFIEIFNLNDTLYLEDNTWHYYYLSDNYVIKPTNYPCKYTLPEPLLDDNKYYVYGGCAGEFGGSVFFVDLKSCRQYSYPVTCPTQVLKMDGNYIICHNLAHLRASTGFVKIADPSKLFEVRLSDTIHGNWWTNIDSINKNFGKLHLSGVQEYFDTLDIMSPLTFINDSNLYSIIMRSNYYVIAKHFNYRLFAIDSIQRDTNGEAFFSGVSISQNNNKIVSAFSSSSREYDSPKKCIMANYHSGIIIIRGNKIDILDYNRIVNN